jgi:hypothetical protein
MFMVDVRGSQLGKGRIEGGRARERGEGGRERERERELSKSTINDIPTYWMHDIIVSDTSPYRKYACMTLFNPYEISPFLEGVYTLGIRLAQNWGRLLKN